MSFENKTSTNVHPSAKTPAGGADAEATAAVKSLEKEKKAREQMSEEEKINEALEETFPASDPIAQSNPTVSTVLDEDKK